MDPKSIVAQKTPIIAAAHATPDSRRPWRIPIGLVFEVVEIWGGGHVVLKVTPEIESI
jgi:hypothetical protein